MLVLFNQVKKQHQPNMIRVKINNVSANDELFYSAEENYPRIFLVVIPLELQYMEVCSTVCTKTLTVLYLLYTY